MCSDTLSCTHRCRCMCECICRCICRLYSVPLCAVPVIVHVYLYAGKCVCMYVYVRACDFVHMWLCMRVIACLYVYIATVHLFCFSNLMLLAECSEALNWCGFLPTGFSSCPKITIYITISPWGLVQQILRDGPSFFMAYDCAYVITILLLSVAGIFRK